LFKGLGNIGTILRQAQEMGGKMKDVQERLKSMRAISSTGGGMVEVEVNGVGEVLRLTIDAVLLERGELEMIEDLVPSAVNQALEKARKLHAEQMKTLTDGIELPGLNDALAKFTGGTSGDE
jgi:hypothetical protein